MPCPERVPWPKTARQLAGLLAVAVSIAVTGCDANDLAAPNPAETSASPTASTVAAPLPHPRCVVIAAASVDEGVAPLEVALRAEGLCSRGSSAFLWDFGDGSRPADGQTATHVYDEPGTYIARVTITDTQTGAEDADEAPITVSAR